MKFPEFTDDLSIVSKLGDNPGADNGLTAEGLKAKFDEGPLALQRFLNSVLIAKLNEIFAAGGQLNDGLIMTGPINMNQNMLFGLADPKNDSEAVSFGFVKKNYVLKNYVGTNKVFNKLTDIGITSFPTTMQTVANAMPNNSTLMLDSRDIIADGTHEISDLGLNNAGMYMFMRGNSNARLSLLHIYGATSSTTSYMNYGCYAATSNEVVWVLGERQNSTYPDCRYRIAADGETEWINPPMLLGTEYRTAERYQGKVVYAKLVNFGALPNNTKKQVDYYSDGVATPIYLTAMLSTGSARNVLSAGKGMDRYITAEKNVWLDCSNKYIRIVTDGDYSSVTANVLVKYTKD